MASLIYGLVNCFIKSKIKCKLNNQDIDHVQFRGEEGVKRCQIEDMPVKERQDHQVLNI